MSTDFIDNDLFHATRNVARRSAERAERADRDADAHRQRVEQLADLQRRREELDREHDEVLRLQALQERRADYDAQRAELEKTIPDAIESLYAERDRAEDLFHALEDAAAELKAAEDRVAAIHDDEWTEDRLEEELESALSSLAQVRDDYNRVAARLDELRASSPLAAPSSGFLSSCRAFFTGGLDESRRNGLRWASGAVLPFAALLGLLTLAWWLFLVLWW
jgi:chromosome segregation ATPase